MELLSSFADTDKPRGSVLIAHGFAEHHGRYTNLKRALNDAGYDAWFFDFINHGSAPGAADPKKRARVDVGRLIGEHLEARKELLNVVRTPRIFLFGHSMGGLITLASTLLSPHHIEAVAVTGPALRPLPAINLQVAKMGQSVGRLLPGFNTVLLDDTLLSHDPAVVDAYRADPLVYTGKVPLLTGASMAVQGNYVIENAPILARPTLILHGSSDGLADMVGSVEFVDRANGEAELEIIEDAYHELLNEPDREQFEARIIDWYGKF